MGDAIEGCRRRDAASDHYPTELGNANLSNVAKPKKKCCVDKPRCKNCPIRMLAEGTLPKGYTVKKRRLVKAA